MDSRFLIKKVPKEQNDIFLLKIAGKERKLAASKKITDNVDVNVIVYNNPVDDVWIRLFLSLIPKEYVCKFCLVSTHFNNLINKNIKFIVDKLLYEECCIDNGKNLLANQKQIMALFKRRLFYLTNHPSNSPKWPTSFKDLKMSHYSTLIEPYRCVIQYMAVKDCYNAQIVTEYVEICKIIKLSDLNAGITITKKNEELIKYIRLYPFSNKLELRYKLEIISPRVDI